MHHFPVGGDDRQYARRLARLVARADVRVDEVPRTPLETLHIMARSSLVVCMRFHSLVFAHQIGAPLVAIDYTDGGKVASYLDEQGLASRGVTIAGLATLVPESIPELAPVVHR
jgi:polysaccharide pyruvyl transferase WcaK-like protein